ncbi:ATP-binding protein [Kordiimonas aquimaris]|uniref:ATP-binding protein n=1 Tax=Kordiimonas aquimaris TaxID=707591 RepID=UPI0021D14098|nr:ATP-binding protein [Kordiimonas aquimaris]
MAKKNQDDKSILNERTITVVLLIVLTLSWAFDLIDTIAGLFILLIVGGLLIRLEIERRYNALDKRRNALQKKRDMRDTGVRSVRANALDGIPLPIVIIAEDHRISFANASARELLGEKIVDDDITLYLRHSKFAKALKSIFVKNKKNAGVVRHRDEKDRSFDVTITRVPGTGKHTIPTQAMAFFYEVTSLLQTEQMRVDFVANASHELRTPLSSLIGFVETLQGPAKDDPPARERFLTIMQTEAGRMVRLIDDLLSLSKIEMSRHSTPDTKVDIKNLIEGVVTSATQTAESRGITFDVSVEKNANEAIADADQIMQVMLNLIVNAAKYADRDTVVSVKATIATDARFIKISVSDKGPGIGQEHLSRLTERFYRVDDARSRKMGGTGLGLAIVKHILLRHESQLKIKSKMGVGTTFTFRLTRP